MIRFKSLLLTSIVYLGAMSSAIATTISIQIADAPGEGFNDPTAVAPVTGNPGVTLGQQRLNVFQAAADYWETKLDSDIEIIVNAQFDPQFCSAFSATLGSAGPMSIHRDFPSAPVPNTWHVQALANSLRNADSSGHPDINATFNSNLDSDPTCLGGAGWVYVIGEPTGSSLELFSTVIHEIGHGLGFLSLVNSAGQKAVGFDDAYMRFLHDKTAGLDWPVMTDGQRAASYVNTGNLVWTGLKAVEESDFLTSGLNTSNPQMFAPNPAQGGSSVSHWDTALVPNEVMEPSATATNEDWLTIKAFYDMGWQGNPCLKTTLPDDKWTMISLECVPPGGENTIADLFGDEISGTYGGVSGTWIVFGYDPATNTYTSPGLTDQLEIGKGYWIIQTTGTDVILDIPRDSHRTPVVSNPAVCTSVKGCYEYPLATVTTDIQWDMLGNPFLTPVGLDDLRVITDSGACAGGCTMTAAKAAEIVNDQVWTFNASSPSYITFGTGSTIPARTGIWAATLEQADGLNPRLLIPYN